jgi:hypothetical protein
MTDDRTEIEAFLKRTARVETRERMQRMQLRPIQFGAANFIAALGRQAARMDDLVARMMRLQQAGAGYAAQIAEVEKNKRELERMQQTADEIRLRAVGPDSQFLGEEFVHRTWRDEIEPLRINEAKRQLRAMRVQGPMIQNRVERGHECGGLLGEAVVHAARLLREAAVDSGNRLGAMWRWLVIDKGVPTFWFYSHDANDKWKCLYFRMEITRTTDDLDFQLECYVPFGLPGDPGQYPVEASQVISRPGWRRLDVFSESYNRSNTYSLNRSTTRTAGSSFGVSSGTNHSSQVSTTHTDSTNYALSTSDSLTEGFSWFESEGRSQSGSFVDGNFGSNTGYGQSGNSGMTVGKTETIGGGTSVGTTEGVTIGTNESTSVNLSDSVAEMIGDGFALTNGSSITVTHYNYGIDYSQSNDRLLEKWRTGNPDASRDYDAVIRLYESVCRKVIAYTKDITKNGGSAEGRDVESRLDELATMLLVEQPATEAVEPVLIGTEKVHDELP